MKQKFFALYTLALLLTCSLTADVAKDDLSPSAKSLQKLKEGNIRFSTNHPLYPHQEEARKISVVHGQKPFAIILSCADSRVPPELIFDQGIGDIFVVRAAGNVAGPIELDSIEFAANHLQAPLIVVMGHQHCGAVKAVMANQATFYDIENIAPFIQNAVSQVRGFPGDTLECAVIANAINVADNLFASPVLAKLVSEQKLRIIPAYYDLATGKVVFFENN